MAVTCAMTQGIREKEDKTFYYFTETAPQELRDLFLENYEVNDLDYEIFSKACDIIAEMSVSELESDEASDAIQERESASVYTFDRLQYLDNSNQHEISEFCQNYKVDIATACAIWYDEQVQNACGLIREYIINGND